jgi:hypothetical protein
MTGWPMPGWLITGQPRLKRATGLLPLRRTGAGRAVVKRVVYGSSGPRHATDASPKRVGVWP